MTAPAIATAVGRIQTLLIHLATLDAATANVARYRLPQKALIVRIAAACRAKTGGMADAKIMVEAGGTNLLTAGIDVGAAANAAGTYLEGTLAAAALVPLDKETEITVDQDTCTGGNSCSDVTVQIDYLPED
jgi:hypothetical protein